MLIPSETDHIFLSKIQIQSYLMFSSQAFPGRLGSRQCTNIKHSWENDCGGRGISDDLNFIKLGMGFGALYSDH